MNITWKGLDASVLELPTSGYPDYTPKADIVPSLKIDAISGEHDISSDKIKRDYLEHGDEPYHIKQTNEKYVKYIRESSKQSLKAMANRLTNLKKDADEHGLPTKTFTMKKQIQIQHTDLIY